MGWLEGTTALVTGGGSGLGRAVVERFIAEGATVGVLELNPDKAKLLTEELGGSVVVVEGDATDLDDNRRAVAETVGAFGKLDTFVGNAAVWDYGMSIDALPGDSLSAAFDELFGLNVKGCLLGAKAAIPELRKVRGSVIFSLSNAGFYPGGGGPLYTASKHALVGLVKQLAYELAPDIRVNGVAPGGMQTDLRGPRSLGLENTSFRDLPVEDMLEKLGPLQIRMKAADYAGHYVLLASEANSRTTTGSVHICDGGVGIRGRQEEESMRAEVANPSD